MPKILVVDDSRLSRAMTKRMLGQYENIEIVEASDGAEALERYKAEQPDAVIMDMMMPGISGREALEKIREIDQDARVIIMSADSQDSTVADALETGAVYFVPKPTNRDQLAEVLEQALGVELN